MAKASVGTLAVRSLEGVNVGYLTEVSCRNDWTSIGDDLTLAAVTVCEVNVNSVSVLQRLRYSNLNRLPRAVR